MNGHENTQEGFVDFPTDELRSTGEGGISVYLIVEEAKTNACFVPSVRLHKEEVYLGARPEYEVLEGELHERLQEEVENFPTEPGEDQLNLLQSQARIKIREEKCFAGMRYYDPPVSTNMMSRAYDTIIQMGTTDWSGSDEEGNYWMCEYSDLSTEGQMIYESLEHRHPNATLRLLTFLDT